MTSHSLVTGFLEKVSWKILDQYPKVVSRLIRKQSGVYALYRRDKLYYVGLASNLMARLRKHLQDRHGGSWDTFSVYLTIRDEHMKELESLMLRVMDPPGNRQKGKFLDGANLFGELNAEMQERDADERARLLGGRVAKRRQSKKARSNTGTAALVGAFPRAKKLLGYYKGYEYRAGLRQDGRIYFDGVLYDSPSAAAAVARARRTNGWRFWHFKDAKGDWVPLRDLRK
jgi:RAMA domain-containing protein